MDAYIIVLDAMNIYLSPEHKKPYRNESVRLKRIYK